MEPINLNSINDYNNDIDLIICSASFESRAVSIIKHIKRANIKYRILIVNERESNLFEDCISTFKAMGFQLIIVDFENPIDIIEKFNELTTLLEKKIRNILVDISTFTHEGLLITLKYLDLYKEDYQSLIIAYVCAKEYSINEHDSHKKWLSKGIKRVNSILGYPGNINPSKKNHLIILFGFEEERTLKLIHELDYEDISLGFGNPEESIAHEHFEINRDRHEKLLQQLPNAQKFIFSLRDPQKTYIELLKQAEVFVDYNIVIAPMNNKLSTLGAGLAALRNPHIQLCYAKANEYNVKGYSSPSDSCYIFYLDLKKI